MLKISLPAKWKENKSSKTKSSPKGAGGSGAIIRNSCDSHLTQKGGYK